MAWMRATGRAVETLGIFGAAHGPRQRLARPVVRRSRCRLKRFCSQAQAGENNRKAQTGRLSEGTLQQGKDTGAEKKDREGIACSNLADGEIAELKGERQAPDQKGETKNRPALKKDAGPFILGQE